jgi:hypothetical protein
MHCACTFRREGSKALPQGDQAEEGKTSETKRRLVQIFSHSPCYSSLLYGQMKEGKET